MTEKSTLAAAFDHLICRVWPTPARLYRCASHLSAKASRLLFDAAGERDPERASRMRVRAVELRARAAILRGRSLR